MNPKKSKSVNSDGANLVAGFFLGLRIKLVMKLTNLIESQIRKNMSNRKTTNGDPNRKILTISGGFIDG